MIAGLTGGIASGKSSAGKILAELGAKIVDSDVLARVVVEPGRPALAKIVERFGDGVIAEDGTLDREKLRDIVFKDGKALNDLNAIIHPEVFREIQREIADYRNSTPKVPLVLDIPLLYEAGAEAIVDVVVVVYVDRETQIKRLMARDGFSRSDAENRIDKQMDLEEKKRRAEFVVDNTGSLDDLRRETENVFKELMELMGRAR
ncbi:MAG: dephospho-CoA kinase [Deltaproteobacteria bacterium]|uniref:Dephospho-CoA kinase n=1 Tax=Candidatus Zymogenus saltonus TaxID=2844893 RepID=A0A9D8KEV7_9DELT|nr:dephospho-CoA kinase [Candidatus Zymogenus saltonus]